MPVPWKVARNARKLKTRAIATLKQATAVREPLQRSTTHYTGKRLDEGICSKSANVESILIQIVGEVSQQECTNCLQNDPNHHSRRPPGAIESRAHVKEQLVNIQRT
ncbi:unnamed protein product [Penicillium discolor]